MRLAVGKSSEGWLVRAFIIVIKNAFALEFGDRIQGLSYAR